MGLIAQVEKKKREFHAEEKLAFVSEEPSPIPTLEPSDISGRFLEVDEIIHSAERQLAHPGHEHLSRVPTGIEGLDEVMEGGLRKGTVNLVGGGAGCGKSILSMQYLVGGIIQYNEPGMYISFEENPEKIIQDFRSFGWDLRNYVEEKKLVILYYTPEQVERFLESGGGIVRDL